MTITPNDIFSSAACLLGLRTAAGTESAGADTLKANALPCVNAVISELTGYNKAISGAAITPAKATAMTDSLTVADEIAEIMPIGVARLIAVRFDIELADYYRTEFYDGISALKRRVRATAGEVTEVY